MTRNHLLITLLCCICFISCSKKEKSKSTLLHGNGQIKREIIEIGTDKVVIKDYYENGKLKAIAEAEEEVQHGKFEFYHKNGNLSQKGVMYHGKANGELQDYYEDGTRKRKTSMKMGKYYGCCDYMYRENGSLRRAGLYNFNGDLMFITRYNSDGSFKAKEGQNMTMLLKKSYIGVGDSIVLEIAQYIPKNVKCLNTVSIYKNNLLFDEIKSEDKVFTVQMNEVGKYNLVAHSNCVDYERSNDSSGKTIEYLNGKLEVNFNVVGKSI